MTRRQTGASVAVAAVVAAAAFGLTSGVSPTSAAWTDTEYTKALTTGVTPVAPTALKCAAGSGGLGGPATVLWTASTGPAPSGYTVKWTGTATGQKSVIGNVTTTTIPTTGFNVASSVQVRVYADYGTWQSAAGTQFVTVNGLVGGLLWGCSPT